MPATLFLLIKKHAYSVRRFFTCTIVIFPHYDMIKHTQNAGFVSVKTMLV
jgi:hypothetical protein